METEFVYYSPVVGRAARRYPSMEIIGGRWTDKGHVWEEGAVVAIPLKDRERFMREYGRMEKAGDITKRSKEDFDAYVAKRQKEREEARKRQQQEEQQRAQAQMKATPAELPADPKAKKPRT